MGLNTRSTTSSLSTKKNGTGSSLMGMVGPSPTTAPRVSPGQPAPPPAAPPPSVRGSGVSASGATSSQAAASLPPITSAFGNTNSSPGTGQPQTLAEAAAASPSKAPIQNEDGTTTYQSGGTNRADRAYQGVQGNVQGNNLLLANADTYKDAVDTTSRTPEEAERNRQRLADDANKGKEAAFNESFQNGQGNANAFNASLADRGTNMAGIQQGQANAVAAQANSPEAKFQKLLDEDTQAWQDQQDGLQAQMAQFQRQAGSLNARMGGSIAGGYGNLAAQGLVQGMDAYNKAAGEYSDRRRQLQLAWMEKQIKEKDTLRGHDWAKEDAGEARAQQLMDEAHSTAGANLQDKKSQLEKVKKSIRMLKSVNAAVPASLSAKAAALENEVAALQKEYDNYGQ